MSVNIAQWGNSLAVRIPSKIANQTGLRLGEKVNFLVNDDLSVTIQPVKTQKKNLADLLAKITDDNLPDYQDFEDHPQGGEVW